MSNMFDQNNRLAGKKLVIVLACALLLGSCATARKPDLERLYMQSREVSQPPVILIHGVMGARLRDAVSGEEAWYGNLLKLTFSDYTELALEIDPKSLEPQPSRLQPGGLAEQAAGKDYYGSIIRTLERAGHYRAAKAGRPQAAGSRN